MVKRHLFGFLLVLLCNAKAAEVATNPVSKPLSLDHEAASPRALARRLSVDETPTLATEERKGGAEEPKVAASENDILAKIDLLRGSLSFFEGKYQNSTLLHGANLYENNVINGLYTLLVATGKKSHNGHEVVIADLESTKEPLGKLLYQFFHRNGNTLAPTKSKAVLAYYLTPVQLGQLYAYSFDFDLAKKDLLRSIKPRKLSWPQFNNFLEVYSNIFEEVDADSGRIQFANLARVIILAFFWSKFLNNITISFEEAKANLEAFYAELEGPVKGGVVGDNALLTQIENQVITNISSIYLAILPKPPVQGEVILSDGVDFPDCGESCWRGLFLAAFHTSTAEELLLDSLKGPGFYSAELVDYFKSFSTLSAQNSQLARDKWGAILSSRPFIDYISEYYDLRPNFVNMMCLLAQLVPGSYQKFLEQEEQVFEVVESKSGAGAGAGELATGELEVERPNLLPGNIYAYLHTKPKRAEKFLKQFADDHGLKIFDFETRADGTDFKIRSLGSEKQQAPILVYNMQPTHVDCNLVIKIKNDFKKDDPLVACNELSPQMPIIFTAYDLANNGFFQQGYLSLMSTISKEQLDDMIKNIKGWGQLRPEDEELASDLVFALYKAKKYRLDHVVSYLMDGMDKKSANLFLYFSDTADEIEDLIKQGFDINAPIVKDNDYVMGLRTLLGDAVLVNDFKKADMLLEHGADLNLVYLFSYFDLATLREESQTIWQYVQREGSPEMRAVFAKYTAE